jgi:hypothetical protein
LKRSEVKPSSGRRPRAEGNFYLGVALVVALVVAVGFGRTLNARLIHPSTPRPWILYFHVVLFTAWVLLFITQAALVRTRRMAWHRRVGIAGIVLGVLMPVVGIATALEMTRLHRALSFGRTANQDERFLIVSFFDMLAFAVTFGLAIHWRRLPEYHRRLMLMASCGLTVAAFARFPNWLMPANLWYAGVDARIVAGAVRDWMVARQVHPVYLYGLPALAIGQAMTMWIYLSGAPAWIAIAHWLLR